MNKRYISIHALREEGDSAAKRAKMELSNFYPRPPRGGRPYNGHPVIRKYIISIHALREEGDVRLENQLDQKGISIHALREEGDPAGAFCIINDAISIHALREEGDSKNREKTLCFCLIIHLSAQIAKRCL